MAKNIKKRIIIPPHWATVFLFTAICLLMFDAHAWAKSIESYDLTEKYETYCFGMTVVLISLLFHYGITPKGIVALLIFVLYSLAACHTEETHNPLPPATNGITYEIQDRKVTILSISATDTDLVIPSYIEGLPVKKIGSQLLYQNTTCINLILPETLETIESAAFYRCYSLTEIEIPKSVSNIGSGAFFRCASLLNIRVDKDNTHYQDIDGVLYSKDGKALLAYPEGRADSFYSIPEGVTTIADDAFGYHPSLCYVFIPDSVVNFPNYNIFLFPDEITIIASDNGAARKYADQYGIRWQTECHGDGSPGS